MFRSSFLLHIKFFDQFKIYLNNNRAIGATLKDQMIQSLSTTLLVKQDNKSKMVKEVDYKSIISLDSFEAIVEQIFKCSFEPQWYKDTPLSISHKDFERICICCLNSIGKSRL